MKVMHNPPSKVQSRICELLAKEDKELVHLAYGTENENNTVFFTGIACKCNDETPNCCIVIRYNSEMDVLWKEDESYTYANALIKMGMSMK